MNGFLDKAGHQDVPTVRDAVALTAPATSHFGRCSKSHGLSETATHTEKSRKTPRCSETWRLRQRLPCEARRKSDGPADGARERAQGVENTDLSWGGEDIEIQLFLEGMFLRYGYDFRGYARPSIKRRILRRLALSDFASLSEMQHAMLYDPHFFRILLQDFSINVTEMFRDPRFYRVMREKVFPILRELPFIKIWHAGCSTGEEAYSMAILLTEEKLYGKTRIYATDVNIEAVNRAKSGIYALERIKEYAAGYQQAGGRASFTDYYTARYDVALMHQDLKNNMVFADHNLVTDVSFGEMDLIMCRNVLIYFSRELQSKVFSLFLDSLEIGGFLCLGSSESIRFFNKSRSFVDFEEKEKIYRKG